MADDKMSVSGLHLTGNYSPENNEEDLCGLGHLIDLAPVANGWDRKLLGNAQRRINLADEIKADIRAANVPTANSSSSAYQKKKEKMFARDINAVNYSKSLLEDGDTLVIIRYPNNQKVYDSTGFEIRDRHLVHSKKLIATGSSKFKKMLEDDWYQHRAKRRNGLIGNMPPGVEYVLDLTPPEEGDEALELTGELSCPAGILAWHSASTRVGVSTSLVGGKDESTFSAERLPQGITGSASHAEAVADVINGSGRNSSPSDSFTSNSGEILDYDPIRHRTGIERLLQVIEGKDPRLDSAPKVWTLTVLAKYFECTSTALDHIFTWMTADPNCRIIECLPEASLRIGMMLQNKQIVRNAFSVLVSEEALKIGTEHHNGDCREWEGKLRGYVRGCTRFGRVRDSIDEDTMNTIQHAGRQFAARIDGVVARLLDPECKWVRDLPEFAKLAQKAAFDLEEGSEGRGNPRKILAFEDQIIHYVRGRLLWCFIAELEPYQIKLASDHRAVEAYKQTSSTPFKDIYNSLGEKERVKTSFYWQMVRNLIWSVQCGSATNQIHDWLPADSPNYDIAIKISQECDIPKVTRWDLLHSTNQFNQQVLEAIKTDNYNNGEYPRGCFDLLVAPSIPTVATPSIQTFAAQFNAWTLNSINEVFDPFNDDNPVDVNEPSTLGVAPTANMGIPQVNRTPKVPIDEHITADSPFFSIPALFEQVEQRLRNITASMLPNKENEWSVTCDTLLCLSDEEYKFLPLYADGQDDGTGGVFEDVIPFAEKGPSGPGPAFHTGSTMGSRASSLADWDSMSDAGTEMMSGVNSSLDVEDGYSVDHIDRRLVQTEEDFPLTGTETLTLPLRVAKGKGKEIAKDEDVMSDDFFDAQEDVDDYGFDMVDMEEGNVTE